MYPFARSFSFFSVKRWLPYAAIYLLGISLVGCTAAVVTLDEELPKVKRVAVVGFKVPEIVSYLDGDDPRERSESQGFASQLVTGVVKSLLNDMEGEEAAQHAWKTFTAEMQSQSLSFQLISNDEVLSNGKFSAVVNRARKSIQQAVPPKQETSFISIGGAFPSGATNQASASPQGLPNFPLLDVSKWSNAESALSDSPAERRYAREAVDALGVDAVLIVSDAGYSAVCNTCIAGTGTASTAGAFLVTLVDKNGRILMNARHWFNGTGETVAIVGGIIATRQRVHLFEAHGRQLARSFIEIYEKERSRKPF